MTVVTKKRALSVLTLREIELVKHLAYDKDYREAAFAMRMKEQTLRLWMMRMRQKFGLKTNESLVRCLVRCRVVR